MLWPWARQLKLCRGIFFFSSLKIFFEHTLDVFSIFSNSYLLSQKKWVLAYARLDCCCKRAGVSQGYSHFVSFGWRFDPYWLFSLLGSVVCSFNALQRSNRFVMIVFFDEICELSSRDHKSFGIRVKLFVERLQIFAIRCRFNIISDDLMFLHPKNHTSISERLTLFVQFGSKNFSCDVILSALFD